MKRHISPVPFLLFAQLFIFATPLNSALGLRSYNPSKANTTTEALETKNPSCGYTCILAVGLLENSKNLAIMTEVAR